MAIIKINLISASRLLCRLHYEACFRWHFNCVVSALAEFMTRQFDFSLRRESAGAKEKADDGRDGIKKWRQA